MIAEIIGIGTELLLGQIANTDAQFISQQLSGIGIDLYYHTVVGDNINRILEALSIASSRSDIIITTGGLGPTMDDLSKETVAEFLDLDLVMHEPSKERIEQYFKSRGKNISSNNYKQAMMPVGAIVLPNNNGTAPGVIVEKNNKIYIILPGPPHELQKMFSESVLAYLHDKIDKKIISRIIKIYGIGESAVEDAIKDILVSQDNPTIAPLAGHGEVTLRITSKADSIDACYKLIQPVEDKIVSALGSFVYGYDDDNLESVVINYLIENDLTLAVAESCTGGMICNRLTNITGASKVFYEGCITYSNNAKVQRLGVSEDTLNSFGAVSEQTAAEMAYGIRKKSGADIGISVTGIAGPTGGTAEKPVGLVYIGLAHIDNIKVQKHLLSGDRESVKHQSSSLALNMLRLNLLKG